jgi:hypothetical protein
MDTKQLQLSIMKFFICLISLYVISCAPVSAQKAPIVSDTLLESQAKNLSLIIKDSLALSTKETNAIYDINLQLAKQKKAAFELRDRALVGRQLQLLENSRDSLYSTVLKKNVFEKYLKSKKNLLSKGFKGP